MYGFMVHYCSIVAGTYVQRPSHDHLPCHNLISNAIGVRLDALDINIPKRVHPGVMSHEITPVSHVLHEGLLVLLFAQINRLLVLADHANLAASSHVGETEVVLVQTLPDGAFDLSAQDVGAQSWLLADGTSQAHAVHSVKSVDHGADRLEAAGDVCFRLGEGWHNGLREVQEKGFSLLRAVPLVHERKLLVSAPAQLYEVEPVGFERGAELFAFFSVEATFLEFDTVDLDAKDK